MIWQIVVIISMVSRNGGVVRSLVVEEHDPPQSVREALWRLLGERVVSGLGCGILCRERLEADGSIPR